MTRAISILIVDDHPVVRAGLCALLDQEGLAVIAEASGGEEAIEVARRLEPSVVLLDHAMPGMSGVLVARAIHRASPESRIVLMVTCEREAEVARASRAGVVGWIAKDAPPQAFVAAVREAARRT